MTLEQAILATLAYHDIFDYPLTLEEIHKYLIAKKATVKAVNLKLHKLRIDRKIEKKKELYCLRGRLHTTNLRRKRKRYSSPKIIRAKFYARILQFIPTLRLVAVSGALAMNNSDKGDDIDLVLITSRGSLWTTRFLANILLLPFKRSPSEKKVTNKACLNVFIDEIKLKISPPNLYFAHEICQMKPFWDRDGTYDKFVKVNNWIRKYLPNWQVSSQFVVHGSQKKKASTVNRQPSTLENFLQSFQLWYMKRKVTSERISKNQLFFHPLNTQDRILDEYKKRLSRNLP